jgi:hypothetical protein
MIGQHRTLRRSTRCGGLGALIAQEKAVKYVCCGRVEFLNLCILHFHVPTFFRCASLLSFAGESSFAIMDAGVARSGLPDTVDLKKSNTFVTIFSRGAEHQSKSFSKSCWGVLMLTIEQPPRPGSHLRCAHLSSFLPSRYAGH